MTESESTWCPALLTSRLKKDLDKDDNIPPSYIQAPLSQVQALQRREAETRKRQEKMRQTKLAAMGFEGEIIGEGIV